MSFAETRRNVKITMLSEESQTEKERYHTISLLCGILKTNKHKKRTDANELIYTIDSQV